MPLVKNTSVPATLLEFSGKTGTLSIIHREPGADGAKDTFRAEPYNGGVEGSVTGLSVRENEHNGETIVTMSVLLKDENNDRFIVNFNPKSHYGVKFLGKLNAADLAKPLTIRGGMTKAGTTLGEYVQEKDSAWMSVSQGGQALKEDYGNGVTRLPDSPTVRVNGKEVKDHEAVYTMGANLYEQLTVRLGGNAESEASAEVPRV